MRSGVTRLKRDLEAEPDRPWKRRVRVHVFDALFWLARQP